jgi:hypothetical protein
MPDEYALTWEQGIRHLVSQIQGGLNTAEVGHRLEFYGLNEFPVWV